MQPDLSGALFVAAALPPQQKSGNGGRKSCKNSLHKLGKINQQNYSYDNSVPTPRAETIFG